MQDLTPEGRRLISDAAARHGFSEDAALTLLRALAAGGGAQAQFNHPELGGIGQWQQGGMLMIGDMFNQGLKAKVAALCSELAPSLGATSLWRPVAAASQAQSNSSGQVSMFVSGGGWPEELGHPASSGGQNDLSYAYFPGTRRLAIRRGGETQVYDSGDHQISGFSQQQSGDQSLTFMSQFGLVRLSDLARVDIAAADAAPVVTSSAASVSPPAAAPPAPVFVEPPKAPAASSDDIFAKLERLADLRQKGVVTEEEFSRKKAELLDRL